MEGHERRPVFADCDEDVNGTNYVSQKYIDTEKRSISGK